MSPLGFGVSGPHGTPLVHPAGTARLINEAYALGVRLFDTAPFYGPNAAAERRLASGLGTLPGRVSVSTKVGTVRLANGRLYKDFSPAGVVAQARASRDRLCPGRALDLLFLHGPAPEQLTPPLMDALRGLQDTGVVTALGLAGRGPELRAGLNTPVFSWLMCPVGPSQAPVLARAADQGVGVMAIEVLRAARPSLRLPRQPADLWTLARALRDRTRPPGEPGPGIAAALTLPAVRAVLVTTTRRAHLAANARAAGLDPQGSRT